MRLVFPLLALTLVASACDPLVDCPAIDCVDLLQIELDAGESGLAEGTYLLAIDLQGDALEIQCIQAAGHWECDDTDGSPQARSVSASYETAAGPLLVSIEGGFGGGPAPFDLSLHIDDEPAHEGSYEADFSPEGECATCSTHREVVEL